MNAAASILDNNLSSALIVEDDADWDVSLKSQLTQPALGSRHVLNASTTEPVFPYGDGWDMLWLGHCAQDKPSKPISLFISPTTRPHPLLVAAGVCGTLKRPWRTTSRTTPGLIHAAFGDNDIVYDPKKPRKEREKKKGTPAAPNLVFGVRANVRNMIEGKELEERWQGEEELGELEMWFDDGKGE